MAKQTTINYDAVNAQNFKQPRLVIQVEGLPYVFATNVVSEALRYDDPDLFYDGTYNYDGQRALNPDQVKTLIDRANTKMVISQKLEQWDGKSSVETFNMALIDKDGIVTQLITPGILLDEILNKKVRVLFGYNDLSYPEDYVRIFTGYINKYTTKQGKIYFDFTDPSSRKKASLFNANTQLLQTAINNSETGLVLDTTSNLYRTITNALGVTDDTVTIGIVIDDEIMTYTNAGITDATHLTVTRGAMGSVAATHDIGAKIEAYISFADNPISIALKLMLSGWNEPWQTALQLRGIINTDNGAVLADSMTFNAEVDLVRDYGLVIGDHVITEGFDEGANNGIWTIAGFSNFNRTLTVVQTGILVQQDPPTDGDLTGTVSFRSKYDVYPLQAGLSLTPDDVAVSKHEDLRDTFIPFDFSLPVVGFEDSGKTFIEQHIMRPITGYTLTQGSKQSMGLTHPPLATDLTRILSPSNIIKPSEIQVVRGLNERFFYNEFVFNYGYDPVKDSFSNSLTVFDEIARSRMNQISTITIDCRGLPDTEQSRTILAQRAKRYQLRYRFAAETIDLKTFFGVGHLIDAGDIVVLTDTDPPILKIPNTERGERGVVNRVMEVQERKVDASQGECTMRLLSNNGFSITDRYGVIAPASVIETVIDDETIIYQESYGGKFPDQEYLKWREYEGLKIRVHSDDYTRDGETTFVLDSSNPFMMHLTPALSFTPEPGDIIEFDDYDESSSTAQSAVKAPYVFVSYMGTITAGASSTEFTVDTGEGANYIPGGIILVMSPNGTTRYSAEVKIATVVGDVITVEAILPGGQDNLGFTPVAGDLVKLGGFLDGGQSYRYV